MPDIVTIAGSPSSPSRSTAILDHIRQLAEAQQFSTASIQVRALPPEALLWGRTDDPAIQNALASIAAARAVVIATPVYKAAYTGILKAFLDLLPQKAFEGKTIFPIATGGSSSHLLAIDYALKPVLSALSAQYILNGLYIVDSQFQYANGIQLEPGVETRLQESLQTLYKTLPTPELTIINEK